MKLMKMFFFSRYLSSIVTILYKESDFIPLTRSELFGKTDLVASCGGILGLFLGISLISFVEFMYFCVIHPFFYLRKEDKSIKTLKSKKSETFSKFRSVLPVTRTITIHKY